jgi:Tol biopolymer transport system component
VGGGSDAYWKAADGSGDAEALVTGPESVYSPSLSPDARHLVYDLQAPNSQSNDIWIMPLQGDRKPRPLLAQRPMEMSPQVSPDGRFLAYLSRETDRFEVFVRQFPSGPGVWQVSRQGGTEPHWAPDGRRLYFRTRGVLYQVAVDAKGGPFTAGPPERVFAGMRTGENQHSFAPAPDGERFVVLPGWGVSGEATQVNLGLNWARDVRRRLGLLP